MANDILWPRHYLLHDTPPTHLLPRPFPPPLRWWIIPISTMAAMGIDMTKKPRTPDRGHDVLCFLCPSGREQMVAPQSILRGCKFCSIADMQWIFNHSKCFDLNSTTDFTGYSRMMKSPQRAASSDGLWKVMGLSGWL